MTGFGRQRYFRSVKNSIQKSGAFVNPAVCFLRKFNARPGDLSPQAGVKDQASVICHDAADAQHAADLAEPLHGVPRHGLVKVQKRILIGALRF